MRRLSLLPFGPFLPTASELHRAGECPAPWALGLPEAEDAPSEWAEQGRLLHWAAELLSNGQGMIETLSRVLPEPNNPNAKPWPIVPIVEHVGTALERDFIDCKEGVDGVWHVEQGVKWRTDGLDDEAALCDREPGQRIRGWFSGTADLVYVRHDGVLVVADWKFGPREHVTGEPAKDSCQGFFLALAFCTALGITGSSDAVVVARFERRMVSEDEIETDAHDITWGELCRWRDVLAGLAERITSAVDAAPKLSAACGHCKAKAECPAWDQLEALVVVSIAEPSTDEFLALVSAPQTDGDVRTIHHAIEAGERLVGEWKRLREAYVLTHPEGVIVGLGLKLKAIPSKDREVLDTPEGLDAIERIVPGGVVFERKAGIGTIEKAIAAAVGKANITSTSDRNKTKKGETERVFAELAAVGAVIDKGKKLTVRIVRSDEKEY
jgi:hypothetical protein